MLSIKKRQHLNHQLELEYAIICSIIPFLLDARKVLLTKAVMVALLRMAKK